jgi:hypothetical protein
MEGIWISNIRRHRKHLALGLMKPAMGGSKDGCNGALGTLQLNMFAWNQKLTKHVKDGDNLEMEYNFSFKCNKKE